jgi:hypothetical protein
MFHVKVCKMFNQPLSDVPEDIFTASASDV